MSSATLLKSLFDYKAWANQELFGSVATVDESAHPAERHAAIRLLNHMYVVDCIFFANLRQERHAYTATNTPETPLLNELLQAVTAMDAQFSHFLANTNAQALEERISFTFTDGDSGRMSGEEMLMHVIAHGTYHRGAVGRILAQLSIAPPRDLYTKFLHASEPERRSKGT
ncbi:DinB family protein [Undibacterium sp. Jales W-56]|uniref:DinB family protein n=1 Tax=Undibacterium sp. Jales W-56 TaxID=2897325 RepID=UPI0021CEE4A2|nr:DinB family protein [Undibacterium sp. Jales W-56]MCU6434306.1 DinB family protein [Undibacterium sp. Jales W-56]